MKNKRGFTLIELLAVLVILAILALITIPIVMSIIKNARENSYRRSIETYGRAVETAVMEYEMNNEDNNALPSDITSYNVKTSKNKVECDGKVYFDDNGSIILKKCHVGTKSGKYTYYNGRAFMPEYSVGDEITVAGEKYYVIADSGIKQDYVTALKANPLKATEIEAAGGTIGQIYEDTNITGGMQYHSSSSTYAGSYIEMVVNNWASSKFTQGQLKTIDGYAARLIKFEELQLIGYANCPSNAIVCFSESTPSWIYSLGSSVYCTMSPWNNSATNVWGVGGNGYITGYYDVSNYFGLTVRPVINVKKSAIED